MLRFMIVHSEDSWPFWTDTAHEVVLREDVFNMAALAQRLCFGEDSEHLEEEADRLHNI